MDEVLMNSELQSFLVAMQSLTDIDDNDLTDEVIAEIKKNLDATFSNNAINHFVNQIINDFEEQGVSKAEVRVAMDNLIQLLKDQIYGKNKLAGNKKVLIDEVLERMFNIFDKAADKFHSYAIELPMVIADGAKVPTYAHDTDAAADLYALEDTNLNGHTYGNLVRTGVKIQLPEGWLALIMPRSGMSKNTPFRISNSVGLIDSGYRGEIGVLLDNTSDADSYIAAGTRIAQMLVMPSYRFQPKVVDVLTESDRGEGGFGSSGNN